MLILILYSSLSFSESWYDSWPTSLNSETNYYRGQRTNLASFKHLIDMLVNPSSERVITSRMFRTFQEKFPKLNTKELIALSDRQYEYWKLNRMLYWIADCHADPYMCSLPKVQLLMGPAFVDSDLPENILARLMFERGTRSSNSKLSNGEILSFFDPIVSTSYRLDIASSFGRDKDGYDGYVLILNDRFHRNCEEKYKVTANCFINNEEFIEELEFPMWGYVTPSELNGVIVERVTLKRVGVGELLYSDPIAKKQILFKHGSLSNCSKLKGLNPRKLKLKRLKNSISTYFNCHQ